MADYTVTASAVLNHNGTEVVRAIAGEAIAAGQLVYILAADSKAYLADANVSAAVAACVGMAVNSAAIGQPVGYVKTGEVTVGAIFSAAGKPVYLSDTAGKAGDITDATTGEFFTFIGWSTATNKLQLAINASGLAIPA
jgi:hypothetical protein